MAVKNERRNQDRRKNGAGRRHYDKDALEEQRRQQRENRRVQLAAVFLDRAMTMGGWDLAGEPVESADDYAALLERFLLACETRGVLK